MLLKMKNSLSGPKYSFQPGAEVPFDDHFPFSAGEVQRFIDPAGANMAEYVGDRAALDAWLAQWVAPLPALLGSSILPAIVEIGGYQIQLGGIVIEAFTVFRGELPQDTSDVDAAAAWNDRAEADRETDLAAVVDRLTASPDDIDRIIVEPSIVARPAKADTTETRAAEAAKPVEPAPVEPAPPAAAVKPAAKAAAKKG